MRPEGPGRETTVRGTRSEVLTYVLNNVAGSVHRVARLTVLSGEPKRKQHVRSFARDAVLTCGKSRMYDPKPVDLALDRVKRSESCVEARQRCCDTSARVIWG